MATTIYFNGRVTSIPGSYSEVDVSGLAQVSLGASGIIACIGEAEAGQPAVVHSVTNPGAVTKLFKSGDLREGGQIIFDPSNDPDIPGGPQEVKFVKVNPATQSSHTFEDVAGVDSLILSSKDYGAFTEKIFIQIGDATVSGAPRKKVTVTFEDAEEVFDELGEPEVIDVLATAANSAATVSSLTFTRAAGLTGSWSKTLPQEVSGSEEYLGAVAPSGKASDYANPPTLPSALTAVSGSAADTGGGFVVWVYGLVGGLTTYDTYVLSGTTAVPGTGTKIFTNIFGVEIKDAAGSPVACTGVVTIADGSTGIMNIAAGTQNKGITYLGSGTGIETNYAASKLRVQSDGATTAKVLIMGFSAHPPSNSNFISEAFTLSGTAHNLTNLSFKSVLGFGLLELAAARKAIVSAPYGKLLNTGDKISLSSASNSDTAVVVKLYGLDNSGVPQTESVTLTGTTPIQSAGIWNALYGVARTSGTALGKISVRGIHDALLCFELETSEATQGLTLLSTNTSSGLDTTGAVTWTYNGVESKVLVFGKNAAGADAMEEIGDGAQTGASTTTWSRIDGFATGHILQATAMTANAFTFPLSTHPNLVDWINGFVPLSNWTATVVTNKSTANYAIATLDNVSGTVTVAEAGQKFYAILANIVAEINAGSGLVVAAEASSAVSVPANTTNVVKLTGGIEGVTTFANWQAALDLLRDFRVNTIIPLTTDAAVHSATVAHCKYMGGAGRSERDCFLGTVSNATLSAVAQVASDINSRHARMFFQDVKRFNTSGVLEQFEPPFAAAIGAGMQGGSPVGTSLTFKYIKANDVIGNNASYTIQDNAHKLIQSGVVAFEKVPNIGFRVLRNVTTYLIDNNIAYIEGSVNEAVNFAVYNFRTQMEILVGQAGFAGTVNAGLSIAIGVLGQLTTAGAITQWKNLTIGITDDVMTVDVEIAPAIPVNFIKSTIHLVSASFSAST